MAEAIDLVALLPVAKRMIIKRGVPEQDAEDAVQDTFLRACQGIEKFEGRNKAKLSTWLCSIAMNVVADKWRRLYRPKYSPGPGVEVLPYDDCPILTDPWPVVEERILLMDMIGHISNVKQREAIKALVFEKISYAELAERENVSYNCVQMRYRHGVAKLRRRFGNE